jgi:hypothetical protein
MSQANIAIVEALKAEAPLSDGRRARSHASRSKIIRAMMDLHFEDKDAIYREMDAILVKAYRPILEAPYQSDAWQDRLMEMIDRRCEVNEATAPYRISTTAMRRRSKFLKESFQRLHDTEKARLNSILPSQLHTDTPLGRSILVAMSFDTWRMLREDENLSVSATVEAVKQMVGDIIARLDD